MKVTETPVYGVPKNILKYVDHYFPESVMVSDAGITADPTTGKKIVPAGTIMGGATKSIRVDREEMVVEKNGDGVTGAAGAAVDAEGVLLEDVDVTYGPNAGTLVTHGYIDLDKLPEPPHANALTAHGLRMVMFCK